MFANLPLSSGSKSPLDHRLPYTDVEKGLQNDVATAFQYTTFEGHDRGFMSNVAEWICYTGYRGRTKMNLTLQFCTYKMKFKALLKIIWDNDNTHCVQAFGKGFRLFTERI